MRVAIRRVRAAIATVSSNNADVAATDDGLKTWAKALGPARDWDVFALETLPPILEAFPKNRPMVRLAKAVADTRSDENAALRTTLGDPIYRQTMLRLAWLCGAMVWLPTPTDSDEADTAGRRILRRRWKKLAAFLRIADELDTVGLHEMRLRAKRARYTMELFRSLGSAKDADRAIQRLTRLQDRLGAYNDLDTAARLLSAFGTRHGHARGVVLGFLAARALTMRPEIVRSSRKLRKAHKFWV